MQKLFRVFVTVGMTIVTVAVLAATGERQAPSSSAAVPTFSRDVAPILYKNCIQCHRAGEIAPMSLITYNDVRPWSRGIRQAVAQGVMPPWHADAPDGTFENERRLSAAEKDII